MTEVQDQGAPAGADEAESDDAAAAPASPSGAPGWLAPATGPGPRSRGAGRRVGWRLGLVGLVLAGAVGFLLYKGLGTSLNYYVTVRQALSERGSLAGKTFRLQGIVVPGTISHHGSTVAFSVAQAGDRRLQIPVVNRGNPPQLFKKGIPVIVQGHFTGSTFESSQLLVDHTGNYLPQRDGPRNPARAAGPTGSAAAGRPAARAAGPTVPRPVSGADGR